eukprot:41557-Eustigmatos_ZCMA.PRE.1
MARIGRTSSSPTARSNPSCTGRSWAVAGACVAASCVLAIQTVRHRPRTASKSGAVATQSNIGATETALRRGIWSTDDVSEHAMPTRAQHLLATVLVCSLGLAVAGCKKNPFGERSSEVVGVAQVPSAVKAAIDREAGG